MDKRDDTRREVVLDVRNEPITSIDALVEQCHRALSAHLWMTCCWSDDGSGSKIGDFNYLVVSVAPDVDTRLYVQFWSEPGERVLTEVGSGEWCPGAIRYIGPAQRKALEARGYALGGRARNYEKELVIDSTAAAEAAALEVLQIFLEVFAYRGQWRLDIERHRGERADHDPVYTGVIPDDFAKVAARAGCHATVTNSDDTPLVALTRGRRAFLAFMGWRVPGQNLYSLVALQAEVALKRPVSEEAISRVNSTMRFVKVWRTDSRAVRLHMPLVLDGGVTAAWLAQSLQHWIRSWRECERQLRRGAVPTRLHRTSQRAELIH
jgi:Putative bacterial sensory transduction regulator